MSAGTRLLVGALVRLVLLGYGVWFAMRADALGADAPMVSRIGITILFVVLSVLVGEVAQIRTHMAMMVAALRGAAGGPAAIPAMAGGSTGGEIDAKQPIEILLKALQATTGETQQKAYEHLKRLTGQDLPLDAAAWNAWWKQNRDQY